MLLKRELARAHTQLKLEEQRNRGLPALPVISSAEEYQRRGNAAVTKYMDFMRARNILPVRDYMDPAMRERIGEYVPEEQRNFFAIAKPPRAAGAVLALLSLVGSGADARGAARQSAAP